MRNIRLSAPLTELCVIQSFIAIAALVNPCATNSAICNSRLVKRDASLEFVNREDGDRAKHRGERGRMKGGQSCHFIIDRS